MKLVLCDASHAERIRAIFNEAILNSTALYEYMPRTAEMVADWFESKRKGGYPVIGVTSGDGPLLGFGSYGPFRQFPAYKYTVEHSLYVDANARGQGVGRLLLSELIARARAQDYHVLVGAIDSANDASIGLHKKLGFTHAGTLRQVGFKFGRWLDLDLYQMTLDTPGRPMDG